MAADLTLGEQTITVIAPPGRDAYGDVIAGSDTETQVTGCSVQPSTTTEQVDGRDTVVSVLNIYAPIGTPATATSRIRYGYKTYEVQGDPAVWFDLEGTEIYVRITAKRVRG